MSNNNLVDMSTFDAALLSLFVYYTKEDIDNVKKVCDSYSEVLDETIEAGRNYQRAVEEIDMRRRAQVGDLEEMKKNGNPKPLDVFKQEDEKLRDLSLAVFKKGRLVSR
jgi:hypothetical protein